VCKTNPLFNTDRLYNFLEKSKVQIYTEIESLGANYLLSVNLDDVFEYLIDKYSIIPPELIKVDNNVNIELIEQRETEFKKEDWGRIINVKANIYVFSIPFNGDEKMFKYQPSSFSSILPYGNVNGKELHISFAVTDHDSNALKQKMDKEINTIEQYLGWIKNDVIKFNNELKRTIFEKLETRKEKLLKDQGLVASLGIPIRQRKNTSATYTTPIVRKLITIPKPKASTTPFKPEPELEKKIYEEIISTLKNMAIVMERSPSAFVKMGEEDLRTHFLVQLNGQYEGQASGETFNFQGKTDILIRVDGKNIFIAECKFWTGPKGLHETIDQVLGYLSWRDTKVAILLFNRNKDFSSVLSQIPNTVKSHSNYKKQFVSNSETGFSFILKSKVDDNRELIVTLLAFDIPQ
jgi:hypothetical protein